MEIDLALKFHLTQRIWYQLDDFLVPEVREVTKHRSCLKCLTVK